MAQRVSITHWAERLYFAFQSHYYGHDNSYIPIANLVWICVSCNSLIINKLSPFWSILCSFWSFMIF